MFKDRELIIARISAILQVIITLACFLLVSGISEGRLFPGSRLSGELENSMIIIALLWFITLDLYGLGQMLRTIGYSEVFKTYVKAVVTATGFLIAINFLLKYQVLNFWNLVYFGVLDVFVLTTCKNTFYAFMRFMRRKGYNKKQILIIADEDSPTFIDQIIANKDWGFEIRAIMTNSNPVKEKYGRNYEVVPHIDNIKPFLDSDPIDEVIYCRSLLNQTEIQQLIHDCSETGVGFHHHTFAAKPGRIQPKMSVLSQLLFISYQNTPDNYLALKIKGLMDFLFSLFAILVTFPVQVLIAIAIKLDDGGPVFFRQERVGLHGRRFYCLKFRTMTVNAEALKTTLMGQNEQEGPVFKISIDPRVTRTGRLLRKTSLDELPQFINVIRGEMSIVGPRPPIPSEVEQYERWQIRRLSMKPGITCIWQVSGRNNIPFREWMKLDMEYIDNWSLRLDLILILKTFKAVFSADGK